MAASDTPTAAAAGTITIGGDLTVNRLGLGAMRITGRGIWGEPPDVDEAKVVLRRAIELDVNFIDTADSYGPEVSENLIAEALYPYPDDLVIATKGGLERPGPGRWPANGRPDHLKEACDGSLRRLRVEQIQLYQFHRPDPAGPFGEASGAAPRRAPAAPVRRAGPVGAVRRVDRCAARAPARGEDPPHRTEQRVGSAAPRSATPHTDCVRPEPLQPRRPRVGPGDRRVRAGTTGIPTVGAYPGPRIALPPGSCRATARSHRPSGGARLAARPLAGDGAHPRDRLGGTPRRERR